MPVLRSPAPVPSRASVRRTSVSRVARSIEAVRVVRAAMASPILAHLHRRRVALEPLGARDRRPGARERGGRGADPHLGHAPAEDAGATGRRRSAPRRRWAASGSSRRRSRRRPPRSRRPTNTQPARRTRGASASAAAPDELEVLGREGLGEGQRAPRRPGPARAPRRRRVALASRASTPRATSSSSARVVARRRPRPSPARARPGPAGRARPARRRAPAAASDEHVAGAVEAVDADVAGDQALGLLDPEVARARRSRPRARTLSRPVGERGDRVRAAHRGRPRRRRTARTAARMTGCAPGAQTTTSSTPAARAVTTPMTTVLGYGVRPPGT